MPQVAIVGGGVSGLALAHRLRQLAPSVGITLLERESRTGGKIGTHEHAGFRVEVGPNGFLDNNPASVNLCRELGIGDHLIAASESARRNRFLLLRGQLRKLPDGLFSFLFSRVLGWRSKWALLTERFRKPRPDLTDESIDAFARRRANDEIAETLVDAFITGIHAGDPALLSVQAALPLIAAMEREHGSVMRGMAARSRQRRAAAKARGETPQPMRMWSLPEGLGRLIDALRERLSPPPITGASVRRVERDGDGWTIQGEGQDRWDADVVVLTCPAYQQAAILGDLDAALAEKLQSIAYNRIVVVALGYRRTEVRHPLDGFGYLTPGRDLRDVLGVQWCSSIFPGRAPEGHVLLRALCGGWRRSEMVDWDDARLLHAVRAEMRLILQIDAAPVFTKVVRWDRAIPQYFLGHLERVAWIEQRVRSHPGLLLGGNAFHGVSINDCIDAADQLARMVVDQLPP